MQPAHSPRERTGLSWLALLGIAGLALASRLPLTFLVSDASRFDTAYEHGEIARNLASGHGFSLAFLGPAEPTSHQAPLVAWTLAAAYRLWGIDTPAARRAWSVLAAGAGALACVLAALLGERLGGSPGGPRRIGLWAGAGFALYPPLAYASSRIQTINFTIPLLLALILLALACRESPRMGRAFALGATGGLAMLCDPITASPFVLLVAWIEWSLLRGSAGAWRRAFLLSAMALLGASLVLAPWTARNWIVHGRFVPVKNSFGYVLWQGNNPNATGTDKLLPATPPRALRSPAAEEAELDRLRGEARSVDETMPEDLRATLLAQPDETHRMYILRERAQEWIRNHPADYAGLCLRRLAYLLWFDPTNPRSYSLYYRLSYIVLAALALPGIALSARRGGPWAPLYIAILGQAAVHVLVITSARFRLPLEACLMIPAAMAAATLWSFARAAPGSRPRPAPSPAGA